MLSNIQNNVVGNITKVERKTIIAQRMFKRKVPLPRSIIYALFFLKNAQQMPSSRPQYGMQCTSSRGNSRYCKKVNEVAPNYNSSRIWRKNALK